MKLVAAALLGVVFVIIACSVTPAPQPPPECGANAFCDGLTADYAAALADAGVSALTFQQACRAQIALDVDNLAASIAALKNQDAGAPAAGAKP